MTEIIILEYLVLGLVLYFTSRYYLRSLMINHYGGRHVMITGCDSGFGYKLAKKLDSMGFYVFAGCLTEKGGKVLKSEVSDRVQIIALDVKKTKSIEEAFTIVKKALPPNKGLWGLVNNAGIYGTGGPVEWLSRDNYQEVMDVNCFGMAETSRVFLPSITKAKGRIVCMTSSGGRLAVVSAQYTVSKFAAEGYCDCLRRSVKKFGVTVHILEPGSFATDLTNLDALQRNIKNSFENQRASIRKFYGEQYKEKLIESTIRQFSKVVSKDTGKVVNAYVHALCAKYPKYRYIVGTDANFIYRLLWNLPEYISDFILTRNTPLPEGLK